MLGLLTTRESVIVICFLFYCVLLFVYKQFRDSVCKWIKQSIGFKKIFLIVMLYTVGMIVVLYRVVIWKGIYIKYIILWFIIVGIPVLYCRISDVEGIIDFREETNKILKLTILVNFIISTITFGVKSDLFLVIIAVAIIMIDVLLKKTSEYRPAKWLVYMMIVAFSVLYIYEIVSIDALDTNAGLFIPSLCSVYFTLVLYVVNVSSKYKEIFLCMQRGANKNEKTQNIRRRLKVIRVCNLSYKKLDKMEQAFIKQFYTEMKEAEFDDLVISIKRGKEENQKLSVEEIKLMNQMKEARFRDNVEYLSKHVGVVTGLFTLLVGLFTILFKGFVFVYRCGAFDYWEINHAYINISNENLLYEILLYAAGIIIYFALCYIPYSIVKGNGTWYKKAIRILVFICAILFILLIYFKLSVTGIEWNMLMDLRNIIAILITIIIFLAPGIYCVTVLNMDKKENRKMYMHKLLKPTVVSILLIAVSVYVVIFYCFGMQMAKDQKNFKLINDNQVVIFEDKEIFIVSECDRKGNDEIVINNKVQKIVDRKNVRTVITEFTIVEKADTQ